MTIKLFYFEHPHPLLVEILWGWALQGHSGVRHSRETLGGHSKETGVGHPRDTLELGTPTPRVWNNNNNNDNKNNNNTNHNNNNTNHNNNNNGFRHEQQGRTSLGWAHGFASLLLPPTRSATLNPLPS